MSDLQDRLLCESNVIPPPAFLEMRQALRKASIEKLQKRMIKAITESRELAAEILKAYQQREWS
jgi:hypothetical protein